MICDGCGAPFDGAAKNCPYCGRLTSLGRQAIDTASATAAQAAAAHASAREEHAAALARATRHAFYWPLAGMLFCFAPFPSIVGLVFAHKGRALAKQLGQPVPARLSAGLALAVVQIVAGTGLWLWFLSDMSDLDARKEELRARVAKPATQHELSQAVACDLVELELLTSGHDTMGPVGIDDFSCPGKLTVTGDEAELSDVRFSKRICHAQLRYGAAWAVGELQGPRCRSAEPPTAPGSPRSSEDVE